jgi:hypothetical protein
MKKDERQTVPNILLRFAHLLGTEVRNSRVDIPEEFGTGYCAGFVFNEHIRMLISDYVLNEDLIVDNPDVNAARRMIFFKFRHIFSQTELLSTKKQLVETPSVLIATSRINTDDVIAIHTNTATINIEVDADYLNAFFDRSERSPILQSLLANTQPLLFEQVIFPSLQKIVDEMVAEPSSKTFELFFLRIKAEELICRLLMELEKRDEKHLYPLNNLDIQIIYEVRAQILERLEIPGH